MVELVIRGRGWSISCAGGVQKIQHYRQKQDETDKRDGPRYPAQTIRGVRWSIVLVSE
jgi:hypothetical protein